MVKYTVTADEYQLLKILADGAFHSGELLAQQQTVSRAAIWKRVKKLNNIPGVVIVSVRGKGYQLQSHFIPLDATAILSRISPPLASCLHALEVFPEIISTNDYLRNKSVASLHTGYACVAEYQTGGRGRRGKQWLSFFGKNIYLSLAWRFELSLAALSGLSIAIGVALAKVLSVYGVHSVALKWPNDIHVEGKKIAGILVEAKGEMDGPCQAVIGVGVNLDMSVEEGKAIDQPWIDLASCASPIPDRNALLGDIIQSLLDTCLQYQQKGLANFLPAWDQYDRYKGQPVRLLTADNVHEGIYVGLNEQGALILEQPQGRSSWFSGEVSLRSGN